MLDNIKSLDELKENLLKIYSVDTAHKDYKKNWNSNNPTYGQCVPTVLLVNELFGGEIYKLEDDFHYYNLIDGKVIDLTKEQFDYELDYSKGIQKASPFDNETLSRYELLKSRLVNLIEKGLDSE